MRKIIAESNFEPNQYAKSLKLNKRYRFGVLLPEFKEGENSYWEIMRSGCMAAAEDNHFHPSELVFAYFDGTTNLDLQVSGEKLLTQDLDGIVFPANSESGTRFLLEKSGIFSMLLSTVAVDMANPSLIPPRMVMLLVELRPESCLCCALKDVDS